MAKLIVAIAIVGAVLYGFHRGWIQDWFGRAVDSGIDSVKSTQRDATRVRLADPPQEKK
ncbi:MAG TPA: hypothetical protein VFR66_00450 [Burkholderiales bacterium]|nr:hypothetical protein [Burkholderiales bacterium]